MSSPMAAADPTLRSIERENEPSARFANGPRSFTRTTTERPVSRSVTRTMVPKGIGVRIAAVSLEDTNGSPLAVSLPSKKDPP